MIRDLVREGGFRQRTSFVLAVAAAVLAGVAGVALLAIAGWFLTGAAMAGAAGIAAVQAFNYLIPSAAIRGLAIVRTLARYGERYFGHKAALGTLAEVRRSLFDRVAKADPAAALRLHSGAVAARLGQDVDALEDQVIRGVTGPAAAVTVVVTGAAVALSGVWAAFAFAALVLLSLLAARLQVRRRLGPTLEAEARAQSEWKTAYVEIARAASDCAVYGHQAVAKSALDPLADALDEARSRRVAREADVMAAHLALSAIAVAAVLALGSASAPVLALSALAAAGGMEMLSGLVQSEIQRPRHEDAEKRLSELVALPGRSAGVPAKSLGGPVEIVAKGGNLCLEPGARAALTGPSGAGKTRLLETLAGLRDDAPEKVRIDGRPVRDLSLEKRRALFAYVPQDAMLIAGTVIDNLRLARPGVSEAEMDEALRIACADRFVADLPHGKLSWIGADGARLSGGQRKRLALARALLVRRPWLLLDEPSEGLDAVTERELIVRLSAWLDESGSGLILVSHRPAMLALADSSLLLELGRP